MPHWTKTRTRQASKSRRQNSPPFASSEPNSMATGTIRYCPEYRMSLGTQNWKDYFATMPIGVLQRLGTPVDAFRLHLRPKSRRHFNNDPLRLGGGLRQYKLD